MHIQLIPHVVLCYSLLQSNAHSEGFPSQWAGINDHNNPEEQWTGGSGDLAIDVYIENI